MARLRTSSKQQTQRGPIHRLPINGVNRMLPPSNGVLP